MLVPTTWGDVRIKWVEYVKCYDYCLAHRKCLKLSFCFFFPEHLNCMIYLPTDLPSLRMFKSPIEFQGMTAPEVPSTLVIKYVVRIMMSHESGCFSASVPISGIFPLWPQGRSPKTNHLRLPIWCFVNSLGCWERTDNEPLLFTEYVILSFPSEFQGRSLAISFLSDGLTSTI